MNQWVKNEITTGRRNEHTHTILHRGPFNQPENNGNSHQQPAVILHAQKFNVLYALWWLKTYNNAYQYINIWVTNFNGMINQQYCQTQREQRTLPTSYTQRKLQQYNNVRTSNLSLNYKKNKKNKRRCLLSHVCDELDVGPKTWLLIIAALVQYKDQLKNAKVREHVQQDIFDVLIWYESFGVRHGRQPDIIPDLGKIFCLFTFEFFCCV